MRQKSAILIAFFALLIFNAAICQTKKAVKITSFKVVQMEVEDDLYKPTLVALVNNIAVSNKQYEIVEGRGQITKIGKYDVVEYGDDKNVKIRVIASDDKLGCDTAYVVSRADIQKLNVSTKFYLDQTEWTSAVRKFCGPRMKQPAMAFVESKPELPNVLIIGTSISIGYTPFVREILTGVANVYRIPENSNSTAFSIPKMDFWLGDMKWDVIHVNWGLHDLKYTLGDKAQDVPPAEYKANLRKLFTRMQATGAKIIWANTSYYPEKCTPRRDFGDDDVYNKIALEVLKEFPNIVIDDQYTLTKSHPQNQLPNNVHFKEAGYKQQAKQASEIIKATLK